MAKSTKIQKQAAEIRARCIKHVAPSAEAELALARKEGRVGTLEQLETRRMANPGQYARERAEGHMRQYGCTAAEAQLEVANRPRQGFRTTPPCAPIRQR